MRKTRALRTLCGSVESSSMHQRVAPRPQSTEISRNNYLTPLDFPHAWGFVVKKSYITLCN